MRGIHRCRGGGRKRSGLLHRFSPGFDLLMTALYKRLKTASRQHWLGSAIQRTWIAALITMASLGICGAVIQVHWPKAKSIGDIWRLPAEPEK
jgi:hypothetical protein